LLKKEPKFIMFGLLCFRAHIKGNAMHFYLKTNCILGFPKTPQTY